MHVYFISHHFFFSLFTKYKINKIKNQFFVIKKKKLILELLKKKLDKKKKYTLPNEPFFILSKIQKRHNSHDMSVTCVTFNLNAPYKYLTLPHLDMREILEHLRA